MCAIESRPHRAASSITLGEREREKERERERERDRQRERGIDTDRESERDRDRDRGKKRKRERVQGGREGGSERARKGASERDQENRVRTKGYAYVYDMMCLLDIERELRGRHICL